VATDSNTASPRQGNTRHVGTVTDAKAVDLRATVEPTRIPKIPGPTIRETSAPASEPSIPRGSTWPGRYPNACDSPDSSRGPPAGNQGSWGSPTISDVYLVLAVCPEYVGLGEALASVSSPGVGDLSLHQLSPRRLLPDQVVTAFGAAMTRRLPW
jgi:hypothetical protein